MAFEARPHSEPIPSKKAELTPTEQTISAVSSWCNRWFGGVLERASHIAGPTPTAVLTAFLASAQPVIAQSPEKIQQPLSKEVRGLVTDYLKRPVEEVLPKTRIVPLVLFKRDGAVDPSAITVHFYPQIHNSPLETNVVERYSATRVQESQSALYDVVGAACAVNPNISSYLEGLYSENDLRAFTDFAEMVKNAKQETNSEARNALILNTWKGITDAQKRLANHQRTATFLGNPELQENVKKFREKIESAIAGLSKSEPTSTEEKFYRELAIAKLKMQSIENMSSSISNLLAGPGGTRGMAGAALTLYFDGICPQPGFGESRAAIIESERAIRNIDAVRKMLEERFSRSLEEFKTSRRSSEEEQAVVTRVFSLLSLRTAELSPGDSEWLEKTGLPMVRPLVNKHLEADLELKRLTAELEREVERIKSLVPQRDAALLEIIQNDLRERIARGEQVRHVFIIRGAFHEDYLRSAVEAMNSRILEGTSNGIGLNMIMHDPIIPQKR